MKWFANLFRCGLAITACAIGLGHATAQDVVLSEYVEELHASEARLASYYFDLNQPPPVYDEPDGGLDEDDDEGDPPIPPIYDEPDGGLADDKSDKKEKEEEKKWFERYRIRGYTQLRYNQLGATNPNLYNPQDRSIGINNEFFIRRARVVLSGEAGEHVSLYLQMDFASAVDDALHFGQLRDCYADIFLTESKNLRLRPGQSKVPYGFQNLQSSQNRIPLDRDDALNSGVPNERDLGVFLYWAPEHIRERFKYLVDSGLKGSGDYGVLAFGAYNGQSVNRPERNENVHAVARFTYPYQFASGQIFEAGLSGYTGTFTVNRGAGIDGGPNFIDKRIGMHFVWYPQPLGLQGEYNWGEGPELNEALDTIESAPLRGGYLQVFHRSEWDCYGVIIPYARIQYYNGGRKQELNSPHNTVNETEIGVEWAPFPALEATVAYTFANRTERLAPYSTIYGQLVRMQLQWNY